MRILRLAVVSFGWSMLILSGGHAQTVTPGSIPSPRPSGWVVDQAGALSAQDVAALNALGDAVHAQDGAELAVVVIPTTGGADHRTFATQVFNRWEIGHQARNNGLLVFVAINDRAAELILGDGVDADDQVASVERIMQNVMLPQFRAGQPAAAVVAGARACAQAFFGVIQGPPEQVAVESEFAPGPATAASDPSRLGKRSGHLWVLGGIASLFVGIAGWVGGRTWRRHRPRRCRHCSMTMQRLDETADDAHLSAAERTEERIASVDYDVWHCPGCNAVEKLRYGRFFTRFSRCPQCGAATRSETKQTLVAATTTSYGIMRVHERCEACSYEKSYQRSIPRKVQSSSSSSGRSSSGFSGGRSSGRGASGRW